MRKLLLVFLLGIGMHVCYAQQSGTPAGTAMPQTQAWINGSGTTGTLSLYFGSSQYFQVPTYKQFLDSLLQAIKYADTTSKIETRYHAVHTYQPLLGFAPANDNNILHKTGDESASGVKTFTGNPVITNVNPRINFTETVNKNTTYFDLNPTLNTFNLIHPVSQASGKGGAIILNGSNQSGTFTLSNAVSNGPATFSLWFKSTQATGTQAIFDMATTNINGSINFSMVNGALFCTQNAGGGWSTYPGLVIASGNYADGNWHHLVFSFATLGAGGNSIYVDDVLKVSGMNIGTQSINTITGYLGSLRNTSNYFNGEIDQFLIYTRALSATAVDTLYNHGYGTANPMSTGLIRQWDFDDATGSTAVDKLGNSNIALLNTPTWDLNGKIAKSNSVQPATGISYVDGINNSEKGVLKLGDILGGLELQGRAIRHYQNSKYTYLQGLDGHIIVDPTITASVPDSSGSYNPYALLKLGTGTATTGQMQFAAQTTPITPSANTVGAQWWDGAHMHVVTSATTTAQYAFGSDLKDSTLLHTTGNETKTGVLTFKAPTAAYDGSATAAPLSIMSFLSSTGVSVMEVRLNANMMALGSGAGSHATTGSDNTFVGYKSGYGNTTGGYNTFVGYESGFSNNTGERNSFLGFGAGESNTTGGSNSFFGYFAGSDNVTGTGNSFFGESSGALNHGSSNSFFGASAGYWNDTGTENSFFGAAAGNHNSTGFKNSFFGVSGWFNTTGYDNNFFGANAGLNNTTGYGNNILGTDAGSKILSGNLNILLGEASGYSSTTGNSNIIIGPYAGSNNQNSTTPASITTGSSNIIIGNQANVPDGTQSKQLSIGNLIYGTGLDGTGSTISTGYIGIGVTNPDAKLAVAGTVHAKEVKINLTGLPDYVFDDNYSLATLPQVKAYIDKNHHLSEIPSAQEVERDGMNLGEMNAKLLKKIEELTLYLINKDKEDQQRQQLLTEQQQQINDLKKQVENLATTIKRN